MLLEVEFLDERYYPYFYSSIIDTKNFRIFPGLRHSHPSLLAQKRFYQKEYPHAYRKQRAKQRFKLLHSGSTSLPSKRANRVRKLISGNPVL